MLGVTLPDWIDADNAQTIALVVGVGALVLVFVVIRFVQKLVFKSIAVAALVGIAALAWYQRAELSDCAQTCECKVLGITIDTPLSDDPECVAAA